MKSKGGRKPNNMRGRQSRKDSKTKRVNLDNAREDRVLRDIEDGKTKPGANDSSELRGSGRLLDSAASLPFATILGSGDKTGMASVPGIMQINFAPSYMAGPDGSILNKAWQQIYSYIVHANSRNYKYDFTDLGMYCMAGIDVYIALAEAIRVYGAIKLYKEQNMYLADGLVRALGFDPVSIRTNLSSMWFDINNLIMQTRQIWIPNILPIMQRWIRMASTVYTDATGDRSQIYLYRRAFFWQLNETASTEGTCLTHAWYQKNAGSSQTAAWAVYEGDSSGQPSYGYTWPQFKSMIQHMIDQLVASQDRGMIYGDILKAYGPDKIYAMPEVSVDYAVTLEYNAEVLTQIENVTVGYARPTFIMQTQTPEPTMFQTYSSNAITAATPIAGMMPATQVLNFHVPTQPTADMIAVATRLKPGSVENMFCHIHSDATTDAANGRWSAVSSKEGLNYINATTGTESPTEISIWSKSNVDARGIVQHVLPFANDTFVSTTGTIIGPEHYFKLMAFDWHPFIYQIEKSGQTLTTEGANPTTLVAAFGDYDNWIELSDIELKKLNQACLYGLLGIPQMG